MYGWIITRDLLESEDSCDSETGVTGPRGISPGTVERLSEGKGEKFKLYDDDHQLYYEGRMLYNEDSSGFEPLDDFGTPNAGCTGIKYRDVKTNKWEYL